MTEETEKWIGDSNMSIRKKHPQSFEEMEELHLKNYVTKCDESFHHGSAIDYSNLLFYYKKGDFD